MTTATVTNPDGISAIDHTGRGVTLPAGTYRLYDFPGEPVLAYAKHPETDKVVTIGRNDPGLTIEEDVS